MNRFVEMLESAWTVAVVLITVAIFIGFPAWLLYSFIAPFFGGAPIDHLNAILVEVLKIAVVAIGITVPIVVASRLSGRWRPFKVVLKVLGYIFLALIIASSFARCISDGPDLCIPSRYVDC